ncbi:hypothetical protein OV079_19580 [Nannocystis pusilla]|uniref:Uncharacterized protein n=1 Tax=Nannocystis pusilla TaxID=889268 RepID=A0A9X3EP49_9BACT|nr:hypothetical protein [Nannocystis pusilla]MCY1007712.1 hypothetical protein [Nannocystis pusilla]
MDPVVYPVRTPIAYWLVVGALFGLAAVAGYFCALALAQGLYSWKIVGLGGLVVAAPVVYLLATPEYRARGELRVGTASVEVPDGRGVPVRFTSARLELTVHRVIVRYRFTVLPVAEVSRGMVIELREEPGGDGSRRSPSSSRGRARRWSPISSACGEACRRRGRARRKSRRRGDPSDRATSTRRSSTASSRRWTDSGTRASRGAARGTAAARPCVGGASRSHCGAGHVRTRVGGASRSPAAPGTCELEWAT